MHLRPWGKETGIAEVMTFDVKSFLDENREDLWKATKELALSELPGIIAVMENDD